MGWEPDSAINYVSPESPAAFHFFVSLSTLSLVLIQATAGSWEKALINPLYTTCSVPNI